MLLRRGGCCQGRYSRSTSRYATKTDTGSPANLVPTAEARESEELLELFDSVSFNCPVPPIGTVCESIEELERQFLEKYEPCTSHRALLKPVQEPNGLIGTTCPVGDTDPTKRYRITEPTIHSLKQDRRDFSANSAQPDQCDLPACPAQQERCDKPACPSSSRDGSPKHYLNSWKIFPNDRSTITGTDSICRTNRSSSPNSKSPRPPLVKDILVKSGERSSRSGTPRDSTGRSQPRDHKRIVPKLFLRDSSPTGTGPDSGRSNNKDNTLNKKNNILKHSSSSKQTSNLRQKTYQHESMSDDEYKSQDETHGHSAKDGMPRISPKSPMETSPDGSPHLSAKNDRYKKSVLSPSDSKKSSAGSSPRGSPKSKSPRKSPSSTKSSKKRGKKKKSKRKDGSRSSSPELEDDEMCIRVDINSQQQTIDGNDSSSSARNNTKTCLNPECPNKSPRRLPCSDEEADLRKTSPRDTTTKGFPRTSRCLCFRSRFPGFGQTSPRHSVESPRANSVESPRPKQPCYNPECSKNSPRRSPRADENFGPSKAGDRCKPPFLTRSPVIPVYDSPPCTSYVVPPSVTATLKDIVNKITTFGLSTGTPEVGPNQPVTGPCLGMIEESEPQRSVRFCNAGTACSGNIEELFFNRDLRKSDASVECECPRTSYKHSTSSFDRTCGNIQNESGAGSSLLSCSAGGGVSCDAARAQYYHSKLLATLQILQNKEETCRVQCESLAVAESRIATLTSRVGQMRCELEQKTKEIRNIRDTLAARRADAAKNDFSMQAQEVENQKSIVKTLQNNLSVIEELYRECFYETAKQEEIIESLRKSCLDVRLMDKEKADQIGKLQNVINNQKWSLDQCQDIAAEVETLKLEISNFLNNSNNDSGMWEREESLATEVAEDLHDIMEQLRLLRDVLAGDCTCNLNEENQKLRHIIGNMEHELGECHRRVRAVECALRNKDDTVKKYKKLLDEKGEELESAQQQIAALADKERDEKSYDCTAEQLRKTQGVLQERTTELEYAQRKCAEHESTIVELRQELEKADRIIKENAKVRSEVAHLTQQVSQWRRQLVESEAHVRSVETELQRARAHARDIDNCYREKVQCADALQEQLEDAHERGAQLCTEARRVVCGVRHWVRNMKQQHRDQEAKIKEQEATIAALKESLENQKRVAASASTPPESSFAPVRILTEAGKLLADQFFSSQQMEYVCDACKNISVDIDLPTTSHAEKTSKRICRCKKRFIAMSDCDRPSCSTPPMPPRRLLKKKMYENMRCAVRSRASTLNGDPERPRRDVSTDVELECCTISRCPKRFQREGCLSPTAELCERVDRLQEALNDGQRRWTSRGCNTPRQ